MKFPKGTHDLWASSDAHRDVQLVDQVLAFASRLREAGYRVFAPMGLDESQLTEYPFRIEAEHHEGGDVYASEFELHLDYTQTTLGHHLRWKMEELLQRKQPEALLV